MEGKWEEDLHWLSLWLLSGAALGITCRVWPEKKHQPLSLASKRDPGDGGWEWGALALLPRTTVVSELGQRAGTKADGLSERLGDKNIRRPEK